MPSGFTGEGMQVRINWNETEINRMLSEGGTIGRAVRGAAGKVRDRARSNLSAAGNVDTGALRNSIRSTRSGVGPGRITYQVGSELPYSTIVHDGRGPVVPRRAKVLRFTPKGGSGVVYARAVGPASGSKYLVNALNSLTAADFATASTFGL